MQQPILVLMAGGSGERFWPRSRRKYPKQLLKLLSDQSLLQESVARIRPLTEDRRLYVVTNRDYAADIRKQLPFVPAQNVLVEPVGRNTAPCIALAAYHIARAFPGEDPVLVFLPSDATIGNPEEMRQVLRAGVAVSAASEQGVLLGMKPTRPETGFGYIQLGEQLGVREGKAYHRVVSFKEKPDLETARRYVAAGDYFWNAGIFIWKLSNLLAEFARHLPELTQGLDRLRPFLDTAVASRARAQKLAEIYPTLPAVSMDYGVLERTAGLLAFPADFGWDDLGSWNSLERYLAADENGNVVQGEFCGVATEGCIVYSPKKTVAALGVSDLVIVETEDVLLVCRKDQAADLKKLLTAVKEKNLHHLL